MLDALSQPQSLVVLGGTSDVATAVVRALAGRRCRTVVLAGREPERLDRASASARAAGATRVETVLFDANDLDAAARTVDACFDAAGDVDMVLVAVGVLSHKKEELDPDRTAEVASTTYAWPASALARVGAKMAEQGHGRIVVLSSVAGVRVRRANFVYGSAKAGLDAYATGLAEALRGTGVRVQIVRPGFVRSKMTLGLPAAPMATTPDAVAEDVVRGMETGAGVIWSPPVLRWVFGVLRLLPHALWRRLPG